MQTTKGNINFWDLISKTGKIPFADILRRVAYSDGGIDSYNNFFDKPMLFNQFTSVEDAWKAVDDAQKNNPDAYDEFAKRLLMSISDGGKFTLDALETSLAKRGRSVETAEKILTALKKNIKDIINLGGNFKKDRLIITDDERGIFDFSLASQGLFRPVEFFSDSYTKSGEDNEFEYTREPFGVILPERVLKEFLGDGRTIFYFISKTGKKYTCERRQKGTTKVFENLGNFCFLGQNDQGIVLPFQVDNPEKVYNGIGEYRLKYASKTKKVYLQFERQEDSAKYVDMFIPVNLISNSSSANKLFNTLMPTMVAAALEEFDIKVRISAFRNGIRKRGGSFQTCSVVIKDYHQSIDERISTLLNLLTKEDFQTNFFGALLNIQGTAGVQLDKSGNPILARNNDVYMDRLLYASQDGMANLFMRYKNWVDFNVGKPFINSKVINQNFQFLSSIRDNSDFYTNEDATDAVIAQQLPYLMYEFYWHMDYLAIEFVPIPKFIDSLIRRFEEDKSFRKIFDVPDRKDTLLMIRKYIGSIIVPKYYSTNQGYFADTPSQTQEKKEQKDRITQEVDEALSKYGYEKASTIFP